MATTTSTTSSPPGGLVLPHSWAATPDSTYGYGPDWNDDKGNWLVYTLPYMEQDNIWKVIPNLNNPNFDSIGYMTGGVPVPGAIQILGGVPKLPYQKCPSDPSDPNWPTGSYVCVTGPNCAP